MGDIYQQIWDADQTENGIVPILDTEQGDPNVGFVKVNSNLNMTSPDLKVLPEAVIPDSKLQAYDLCRVLFDNYALSERDEEFGTPEEREEIHNFVHAIISTVFRGAQSGSVDSNELTPPIEVVSSSVQIVAALINLLGHDPGHESVTLFYTGTIPVSLSGWQLNQNNQTTSLDGSIAPGMSMQVSLDGSGVQLSNRGGTIRILNESRKIVHSVSYSRHQAQRQGETFSFDETGISRLNGEVVGVEHSTIESAE